MTRLGIKELPEVNKALTFYCRKFSAGSVVASVRALNQLNLSGAVPICKSVIKTTVLKNIVWHL